MAKYNSTYLFTEYSKRFNKLTILSIILSSAALILLSLMASSKPYFENAIYFISAVLIFNSIMLWIFKKFCQNNYKCLVMLGKLKTVFDFFVVTISIYYAGGPSSPYIGLYFINYTIAFYLIPDFKKLSFISVIGPLAFALLIFLAKFRIFYLTDFLRLDYIKVSTWVSVIEPIVFVFIISGISVAVMTQVVSDLRGKLNRLQGVNSRLSAMYNMSVSLDKLFDAENILESVVDVVKTELGFNSVCLAFKLPGSEEWINNCKFDAHESCINCLKRFENPDVFYNRYFTDNPAYFIMKPDEAEEVFNVKLDNIIAYIPIIIRSKVTGFLVVGDAKKEIFTQENLILLSSIANQVGAIEENIRFLELVRKGKKEWQNTFDAVKDFILVIDKKGRIVRANTAFVKSVGIDFNEILGKNAKKVLQIENEIIIPNTTDKPISKEIQLPGIDGTFLISLYPIYKYMDGKEIDGGVYVISDVTAIKTAEKKALNHLREKEKLNLELKAMFQGIIMLTASAIDAKSEWTAGHSERVANYSVKIAQKMGLTREDVERIRFTSMLHDIGKIAIPDEILNKSTKLLKEEYEVIKKHPVIGARILSTISHFDLIIPGVKHHHERWDGKGYPYGLSGNEIHLDARILGVADAFDAMVSDRPYRKGLPASTALEEIVNNAGTQFDPDVVSYFIVVIHEEQRLKELESEPYEKEDVFRITTTSDVS